MSNISNPKNLSWLKINHGEFEAYRKQLAQHAGGIKLGCSLYKLPPNKKAFPYHYHHANEEAIYVIQGQGCLRLNNEFIDIKKEDYIALPQGQEFAHQVINNSNKELIYLCMSTMIEPDVMEYPDSNKVGFMTGSAPGGEKTKNSLKQFYRKETEVPYFDREDKEPD